MKLKRNDEIKLLRKIVSLFSKIIASVSKHSNQFSELRKLINYIYPSTHWSILRLDETTNQLFFILVESEVSEVLKLIPVKVGDGICGKVALTGKYQIMTALNEKPDVTQAIDDATKFHTKNIVAVPIKNGNKIMGVFELINVENPEEFRLNSNMHLLQTISNLIGLIFSLSSSHQQIRLSSERDTLTGLYNRSRLNQFIHNNSAADKVEKLASELLVIMIDLDNFKTVNDTYGHLIGDDLLKEAAQLFDKKFRKNDLIIRYGGDEFIIIIDLKKNDREYDVQTIAENKLKDISASLPYSCTLSYGISSGKKEYFQALLNEADRLMYVNKRQKTICNPSNA